MTRDEIIQLAKLLPSYDAFATSSAEHYFDDLEADKRITFIEKCCTHVKGELARKPLLLADHEKAFVANLFGWKRVRDKTRRYREALYFIARKNNKSTLCAAIAVCVLYMDDEHGAECYVSAADRDQASLLYGIAEQMILNEPQMRKRSKIYATSKTVINESKRSFIKAISAEANTKHGYNAHLVINDELHAQPTRDLVDVLMTSTGARKQPLVIHITTSDFEREGSICNEKHDYACKVRDGVIDDPAFLPVIFEALPQDDWTSPDVWRKANPSMGLSVSEEYLTRECKRAQEIPAYQNTFKRLHLNIRTAQESLWLDVLRWRELQQDINWEDFHGAECCGALDLASTRDLTAWTLIFRRDEKYYVRSHFWMPKAAATKRSARLSASLLSWAEQGHITLTDTSPATDYEFVIARVADESAKFQILDIAYDPWNAVTTASRLSTEHGLDMVQFTQNYPNFNEPSKELEKLILCGNIVHDGNPVMTWCVSNCRVATDSSGNIRPVKPQHGEENKIDGVVTMTMALGRAMQRLATDNATCTFL